MFIPMNMNMNVNTLRSCLKLSLSRHKKKCPECRAVCYVSAEDANVNVMIKSIAMAMNPVLYFTRLNEMKMEEVNSGRVLPVFYYNQTMFPGSKLALHLFEPRYKIMMQRII